MRIRVEDNIAKRILIVGGCGGGKSTFSKRLGDILKLDVYHLDKYFWKPGWVETAKPEWREIVRSLVSKESWIIEGNYSGTFKMRLEYADQVFMFDYSTARYIYRIFKRSFKSKLNLEERTDIGEGCEEKWFDKEFYQFVWSFNKKIRPLTYSILEEVNFDKNNLIIFKKDRDVRQYLHDLRMSEKRIEY